MRITSAPAMTRSMWPTLVGEDQLDVGGAFAQGAATKYILLPDQQLGIMVLTNGMPIGAPEAVAQYFMDLVIGGAIENDWLDLYQQAFAAGFINPSKLSGKTLPGHPKPAHPAQFYVGKYTNDYYGPIKVVARGFSLHMLIGPKPTDYPLEHWNGNLFAFFRSVKTRSKSQPPRSDPAREATARRA